MYRAVGNLDRKPPICTSFAVRKSNGRSAISEIQFENFIFTYETGIMLYSKISARSIYDFPYRFLSVSCVNYPNYSY